MDRQARHRLGPASSGRRVSGSAPHPLNQRLFLSGSPALPLHPCGGATPPAPSQPLPGSHWATFIPSFFWLGHSNRKCSLGTQSHPKLHLLLHPHSLTHKQTYRCAHVNTGHPRTHRHTLRQTHTRPGANTHTGAQTHRYTQRHTHTHTHRWGVSLPLTPKGSRLKHVFLWFAFLTYYILGHLSLPIHGDRPHSFLTVV